MKRTILILITSLFGIFLVFMLLKYDIQTIDNNYLKIFWHNIKFISSVLYIIIPLIFLFCLVFLIFTNKCSFHLEKLSIGGFNILFDNPSNIYIKQVRNFLDTKRTVFKIDINHDNFKETLDSYFEVYKFFRDEIKVLGNVKKKRFIDSQTLTLYNLANETIKMLNNFLTEHQSNFRRWYTYIEKTDNEKFYLTPIGDFQKEYIFYDKLCNDFKDVNNFFINKVASKFNIDIEKWGILDTSITMNSI